MCHQAGISGRARDVKCTDEAGLRARCMHLLAAVVGSGSKRLSEEIAGVSAACAFAGLDMLILS